VGHDPDIARFPQWGSFAERVALTNADVNLVAIPDGVGVEAAALLGCRLPPRTERCYTWGG